MSKSSQPVSTRLKKGDYVIVFEDPYTQKKPEGLARLVKLYKHTYLRHDYWYVRFVDSANRAEPEAYIRLVSADDIV